MQEETKNLNVNINPQATPILYTNIVFMSADEFGIVIDFGQKVGGLNQINIASRIGMSREHARKIVEELGKLIVMTEGQKKTARVSGN